MPWPNESPHRYFAERGFALEVVKDTTHGDYSADLLSADRSRLLQRRYGSGTTEAEAERSALRRYHVEQEPPPLPRRFP